MRCVPLLCTTLGCAVAVAVSVSAAPAPAFAPAGLQPDARVEAARAFWIFNAVVDAGRQWGAGLHHNGMSLMVATIPKGTVLYHGTSTPEAVNGSEWLAFEPDHALVFARPPWRGPPPKHPPHSLESSAPFESPAQGLARGQLTMVPDGQEYGYFHTYRTQHDLTVLYADGMSAGKTGYGTTDTQDYLLLSDVPDNGHMGGEMARKKGLCDLYAKHAPHITGTVRTEAGFELILCNFARHVGPPERVVRAHPAPRENGWIAGAAQRYDGLADRLRLHWQPSSFFTAYAYNLPLFDGPKVPPDDSLAAHIVPRLGHLSSSQQRDIRAAVLAWLPGSAAAEGPDWQAAATELVHRYADPLRWLAANVSAVDLGLELGRLLRPFAPADPDEAEGDAWCVLQAVPNAPDGSIAGRAVHRVAHDICSSLRRARVDAEAGNADVARSEIQQLTVRLDWAEFKACRPACGVHEICVVPMWPMGSEEDWLVPACRPKHTPFPPTDSPDYWRIRRGKAMP